MTPITDVEFVLLMQKAWLMSCDCATSISKTSLEAVDKEYLRQEIFPFVIEQRMREITE